jgi:outer membrane immunogenic protein
MIRHILAAASLVMLSTTAFAADLLNYKPEPLMSPAPAFDWTGFHVGVVGGYAVDGNDARYSYRNIPSPGAVPLLPTKADLTSESANVGGAVGYDRQMNGLVLGLEGDMSWMGLGDHDTSIVPHVPMIVPHITFKTDSQMEWLSTIRGRIGIPFDHVLVYGTGGLALADTSMKTSVIIQSEGSLVGSTDDTKVGWTAGGGAELAVADHLTLKAEALYFDLGDVSLNATNPQTTISAGVEKKITGVIARGGIGYKF